MQHPARLRLGGAWRVQVCVPHLCVCVLYRHTCLWWFRHCDTWGHSDARTPQHHTRTKAFSSGGGHRGSNAGSTRYSGGGAGRAAGSDAPLTAARSANSASNVGHAGPQIPRRGPVPAASAAAPLRGRSILSGGVSTGCESVGVGGVSECVNEGVLSERRLSVLELLGCMGQLVSLLVRHTHTHTHVRNALRHMHLVWESWRMRYDNVMCVCVCVCV